MREPGKRAFAPRSERRARARPPMMDRSISDGATMVKSGKAMDRNPRMNAFHPALLELFNASKTRGWLSYEELNNALPDEMVDPDRVHELLAAIDELDIELVDELEFRARLYRARKEEQAAMGSPFRAMSVAGTAETHAAKEEGRWALRVRWKTEPRVECRIAT